MKTNPANLYIDLMKKVLSFSLWQEPGLPLDECDFPSATPEFMEQISGIATALKPYNFHIMVKNFNTPGAAKEGKIWPGLADTMVGLKRLDNVQMCIENVLKDNVAGDFIETGVWRGGTCMFMKAVLNAHGIDDRKIFVADSFKGLPEPEPEKFPHDAGSTFHTIKVLAVSKDRVQKRFEEYGLLDEKVIFLEGWFKDTLPTAPIDKLAIVRLDGDMYSSTMDGFYNLYHKLSVGGYCIIDDYALSACKKAVTDFRAEKGITEPIIPIDWTGAYWRKEKTV